MSTLPLRVLLIDDNELVLETFLALARYANPSWDVRTAPDHDAGLDFARQFTPSVVCADIGRVTRPGLAFARTIRQDNALKNVFLIAITGWGDVGSFEDIDDAGFDVCLTKPVQYQLFTQHIHAFAVAQSLQR
jgi:two-component system CheB/CheR fusion protein